jgi:hypothetical protein
MSCSTMLMSRSKTHSTVFDHCVALGAVHSGAPSGLPLGLAVLVVTRFLLGALGDTWQVP